MLVLTKAFFVNNEIYMALLLNSQAQGVSGKMNNLPKHHGTGPPEARGPMQLHRLHRLKADPACEPATMKICKGMHTDGIKSMMFIKCQRLLSK